MNSGEDFQFPEMAIIRQPICSRPLEDPASAASRALEPLAVPHSFGGGGSVAVAVGSRRIDRLDAVLASLLRYLEARGFSPFIVPAMGSHGGATAEGQKSVLADLNITEASMQAPIAADMEARPLARLRDGTPLYFSSAALRADHIVPVNRIKPHTKFSGAIESGLCKMLTIGLGKDRGAARIHRTAVRRSFAIIEEAAALLLQRISVLFGLALLEDGCGRLSRIAGLPPGDLIEQEKQLLEQARSMMGKIAFDPLDILIVDRIGKDISGIGMDSNVTGRHRDLAGDFCTAPHVKRIFVRDLSEASRGNANGIGLADVTTSRLAGKMDREKTYVNALSAISPEKAAIPLYLENDRQCLQACARTTGREYGSDLRIVRIPDTANLQYLQISRPLEPEMQKQPGMMCVGDWQPFAFDVSGNLMDFHPDG